MNKLITEPIFRFVINLVKPNKNLHAFLLSLFLFGIGKDGKGAGFNLEGGCSFSRLGGSNLQSLVQTDHSCSALFLDTIIDLAVSKGSSCDVFNDDQEILQREISDCPFYDFLLCSDIDNGAAAEYGFDLYYEPSLDRHARNDLTLFSNYVSFALLK